MRVKHQLRRIALIVIAIGTVLVAAHTAVAQTLGALNQRLDEIEPMARAGAGNPDAASTAIDRLDEAEADFARVAENERVDQGELLLTYARLEVMLDRMYTTYQHQKDVCISTIDNGGTCDYDKPEQLALRALYPLSWLRFEGATLYGSRPYMARKLLNEAIDGFTDSTLVIYSPELVRENLLGRAFSERELGKYEHSEYARAVADFKRIMKDGAGTRQYRPAEQGLATTYAAMGKLNEAQGLTSHLAQEASGPQKQGLEMLHLREMFRAEAAASDPARRAELHREIVDFIRVRENDKASWAVAVAAVAQYVSVPAAEFGQTSDGFENWLLATVYYFKHQPGEAAKYYWAAARSGKYPKAYKYAADLYYLQGRLDMVEKVADEIANQPGNPDAPWAAYMRFKVPRIQWERGGMKSAQLEGAWVAGAQAYLKAYPRGQYAFEPRFRLGELLQHKGDFIGAAKQYELVAGNSGYEFTARYNAAECYYHTLTAKRADHRSAADGAPQDNASASDRQALRPAALNALRTAIKMEPAAELNAPASQRQAMHQSRGRAIYMLATLLEQQPVPAYRELASILSGYETAYPAMSAHYNQTFEWRVEALDHTSQFAETEREVKTLIAHDAVNPAGNDFIKEIGIDFWKNAEAKRAASDNNGYLQDAKLTADSYEYFERMVNEGKIPAKNLTGTLSILGESYIAMDQPDRAEAIFTQVVKADAGSPDANAGLARIAQLRKNYKDALELWSRVEIVAAESDPLFYEAKYNMAEIFARQGHVASACSKLAATRNEHPNLGSPEMKAQWGALQHKLCPTGTQS
jgi:tetratricopeptide repeat protein